MAHTLRRIFMDLVKEGMFNFDRRDVEKVLKDDKWIRRCLLKADGDIREAAAYLLGFCQWRNANDVHDALQGENLQDYKKIIRVHGKDKKGKSLLILNISELDRCKDYCASESFVPELILRWFEEMDSGKDKIFSVVFYHGTNKCMENVPHFLVIVNKIQKAYCDFVETFYIFEDVLSFECRQKIEFLRLISGVPVKYVKQDKLKELLDFDIVLYEKENLDLGKQKQQKSATSDEAIPAQKTSKKKKKNNKNGGKKNNNEETEVTENNNVDVKENKGEKGKGKEDELKNVLRKLHDIQMDLNNVIKDISMIL